MSEDEGKSTQIDKTEYYSDEKFDYTPELCKNFVSQDREIEKLSQRIMRAKERTVTAVAAANCYSGSGKTVFVSAVVRHNEVRNSFKCGIIWTHVGDVHNESELFGVIRSLALRMLRYCYNDGSIASDMYERFLYDIQNYKNNNDCVSFVSIMNEIIQHSKIWKNHHCRSTVTSPSNTSECNTGNGLNRFLIVLDDIWNEKIVRILINLNAVMLVTTRWSNLFSEGQFYGGMFYLSSFTLDDIYKLYDVKQSVTSIRTNYMLSYLVLKSTVMEITLLSILHKKYSLTNSEHLLSYIKVKYQNILQKSNLSTNINEKVIDTTTTTTTSTTTNNNVPITTKINIDSVCVMQLVFSDLDIMLRFRYLMLVVFPPDVMLHPYQLYMLWKCDSWDDFLKSVTDLIDRGLLMKSCCYCDSPIFSSPIIDDDDDGDGDTIDSLNASINVKYYLLHSHSEFLSCLAYSCVMDKSFFHTFHISLTDPTFQPNESISILKSNIFSLLLPTSIFSGSQSHSDSDIDKSKSLYDIIKSTTDKDSSDINLRNVINLAYSVLLNQLTCKQNILQIGIDENYTCMLPYWKRVLYLHDMSIISNCSSSNNSNNNEVVNGTDVNNFSILNVCNYYQNYVNKLIYKQQIDDICTYLYISCIIIEILDESVYTSNNSRNNSIINNSNSSTNDVCSEWILYDNQDDENKYFGRKEIINNNNSNNYNNVLSSEVTIDNKVFVMIKWYKTVIDYMIRNFIIDGNSTTGDWENNYVNNDNSVKLGHVYSKLGLLYRKIRKYTNSLEYHFLAIQLYQSIKLDSDSYVHIDCAKTFYYIASVYVLLGNMKEGIYFLRYTILFLQELKLQYVNNKYLSDSNHSTNACSMSSVSSIDFHISMMEEKLAILLYKLIDNGCRNTDIINEAVTLYKRLLHRYELMCIENGTNKNGNDICTCIIRGHYGILLILQSQNDDSDNRKYLVYSQGIEMISMAIEVLHHNFSIKYNHYFIQKLYSNLPDEKRQIYNKYREECEDIDNQVSWWTRMMCR
jgi:hypothetical protein